MPGELWVLIPVVAILSGVLKTWVKVQSQQRVLGASNHELERDVATLRKDRDALLERLENLEAIVVSQTWNVVHDNSLPPAEKELRVASAVRRELGPAASTPPTSSAPSSSPSRLQG